MLALLGRASFAGLFGMLVIVPLVAVAKIVFLFMWSKYVDYGDELTQEAQRPSLDPAPGPFQQGGDGLGPALAGGRRGDDHHRGGRLALAGRPGAVGDQEHRPDHAGQLEVGRAVADGAAWAASRPRPAR